MEDYNRKKKAIIAGITGQDGYYLTRLLLTKNYSVHGLIREGQKTDVKIEKLKELSNDLVLTEIDLMSHEKVFALISDSQPDEIYNLAAISSVNYSIDHPHETFKFNVMVNLNLLESIRLTKKKIKFFHAASSEIYGNVPSENLPIVESTPFNPNSPYAFSKASAYLTTVAYRKLYNIFTSNGVLFNHESSLRPNTFVLKKIINAVARISLGESIKLVLGNIEVWRDWGYAPDYVEGMWRCLQHSEPDDFIFSTGQCTQLKSIIEKTFSIMSLNYTDYVEISKDYFRINEVFKNFGSSEKANKLLAWKCSTNIDTLIQTLLSDEINSLK